MEVLGLVRVTAPRWLHKRWNALRLVSMAVLAFVALADPCLFPAAPDAPPAPANDTYAGGAAAGAGGGGGGEDIPCAVVALLLWMGTLQFFTMSHRLSALTFTVRGSAHGRCGGGLGDGWVGRARRGRVPQRCVGQGEGH